MIDENTIKKAANKYVGCEPKRDEGSQISAERASFMDGAKWMQDKFIASLWHCPEMRPENKREIILISENGLVHCWYFNDRIYWEGDVKDYNIERWCYVDDILPKK